MKKNILLLLLCLALAVGCVYAESLLSSSPSLLSEEETAETGLFGQRAYAVLDEPVTVYRIYNQGNLIGILSDEGKLEKLLDEVYEERYESDFPDSECRTGEDVYISSDASYLAYTNADSEILQYLKDEDLFSLKTTAVSFADDTDVYATIYVQNEEMYENAFQQFLSLFIDEDELRAIESGEADADLTSYGSRAVGVSLMQTISFHTAYVAADKIMRSEEEILDYLEYGEDTEKAYYTVEMYDTVAGVGSKTNGLSAEQVMNINRDKIQSVDQVLSEGEQLCVTYFDSPVNIVVYKDSLKQEIVYPETIVSENDELLKGETETIQEGVNGSRNALYSEKWINGVLVSGTLESSAETLAPVDEIISVGTMEQPEVGTGTFRFPVDNVSVSCGWGCYYGHRGTDFINTYDSWGDVYAADRGVIEENSYNYINGNYVIINHNNGLHTYYGHMRVRSELEVGTIVDKGDVIGHIGMTGRATGPHVHFFIFEDDGTRHDACGEGYLPCG